MAKTRKTVTITLKISAPAGMKAAYIRREVKTRISDLCGHYDAGRLGLPDSAEGKDGNIKLYASNG